MRKVQRILIASTVAILLAFGMAMLAGCGNQNNEDVVREGTAFELDKLKNLDDEILDKMLTGANVDELATYDIDAKEFISTYLEGFDYRIDNVTVDGETATATVVFTCKSYSAYEEALQSVMDSFDAEALINVSDDEVNAMIGQAIMDALAAIEPTETSPVEFTYELINNTWTPTSDTVDALAETLFNN